MCKDYDPTRKSPDRVDRGPDARKPGANRGLTLSNDGTRTRNLLRRLSPFAWLPTDHRCSTAELRSTITSLLHASPHSFKAASTRHITNERCAQATHERGTNRTENMLASAARGEAERPESVYAVAEALARAHVPITATTFASWPRCTLHGRPLSPQRAVAVKRGRARADCCSAHCNQQRQKNANKARTRLAERLSRALEPSFSIAVVVATPPPPERKATVAVYHPATGETTLERVAIGVVSRCRRAGRAAGPPSRGVGVEI